MGGSIGRINWIEEPGTRRKGQVGDSRLEGLDEGLAREEPLSRPNHENTGLESVSIIQIMTQITNKYTVKYRSEEVLEISKSREQAIRATMLL